MNSLKKVKTQMGEAFGGMTQVGFFAFGYRQHLLFPVLIVTHRVSSASVMAS
jgi:hypothetical protein